MTTVETYVQFNIKKVSPQLVDDVKRSAHGRGLSISEYLTRVISMQRKINSDPKYHDLLEEFELTIGDI